MVIAIAAMPVSSLLAILAAVQDALEKAFRASSLRLGAVVAFMTAVTSFTILGFTSAFWAVVAGLVVSVLVERKELIAYWNEAREG
jgi:benzoate membrane transport protein